MTEKKGVTVIGGGQKRDTEILGGKQQRGKGVKFLGTGEERNRLMNHEGVGNAIREEPKK